MYFKQEKHHLLGPILEKWKKAHLKTFTQVQSCT